MCEKHWIPSPKLLPSINGKEFPVFPTLTSCIYLCSARSGFWGLCDGPGRVPLLPSAPGHSCQDRNTTTSSRCCGGEDESSASRRSSPLKPPPPFPPPSPPNCAFPPLQALLFPALSFVQAGRLSSLEFVTRELSSQTHVLFQIYRPRCLYSGLRLLLPSKSDRHTDTIGLASIKRC